MAWALLPRTPTGATYDGNLVWNSTNIEIPDTFRQYVESINHSIKPMYINKYTGFETKKYYIRDSSEHRFMIMLVGNLPRWLQEALKRLAIAMNGAGMILQFLDNWVTGTDASSTTYNCRWVNAIDFVDNSELLCGGSMELVSFTLPADISIDEYQKVIDVPASGLQWDLHIDDQDTIYYRVP